MSYPQTLDELRQQGYKHNGDGECRSCGADIEWWETPRGKKMPTDHGTATPHWSTCPNANEHRSPSEPSRSKVTTATLNMDWLREQARSCHCVVCRKITGR
jgi:hypothetical protein